MKKILLCSLVLIMSVSLCSCGNAKDTTGNEGSVGTSIIQEETIYANSISVDGFISNYNQKLRASVSTSVNKSVSDSDYIACGKTVINKILKNPSSAQYNETSVFEKDDYGRAIVKLDVSAQNSFGGWVRSDYYVCITSVNSDGTFTYSSTVPYCEGTKELNILKVMNHFGDDPADDELKNVLLSEDDFSRIAITS